MTLDPRPSLLPEQRLRKLREIDAPVAPGVAADGIVHGVGDVISLHSLAELVDSVMEKVSLTTADPILGEFAVRQLFVAYHRGEQTHVV